MSDEVWVSGVRLTAEQVAWLNEILADNPDWGNDDRWYPIAQIARAVYGALPVGTP